MEAVKAAARVAPTKAGTAFDQAAGIIIKIDEPDENGVYEAEIMATDTITFFHRYIKLEEFEGEPRTWRVPSVEFTAVLEKARDNSTGKIQLSQGDGERQLEVRSGRTRAQFSLMRADDFPTWDIFDVADFKDVQDLGTSIREVLWAADKKDLGWLGGVVLMRDMVFATNRYRIATMPIDFQGLPEAGIVLPLSAASTIADIKGDIKVLVEDDGHAAYFMPDDDTQIKTALIGETASLPKMVFDVPHTDHLEFNPNDAIQLVELTNIINGAKAKAERAVIKRMKMFVGRAAIAAIASSEEIGQVRDIVSLPGRAEHARVEIHIDAENFQGALQNGGDDTTVTMHYNSEMLYVKIPKGSPLRDRVLKFTKPNGYSAWVIPITA